MEYYNKIRYAVKSIELWTIPKINRFMSKQRVTNNPDWTLIVSYYYHMSILFSISYRQVYTLLEKNLTVLEPSFLFI